MDLLVAFPATAAFVVGLVVGSFANVCVHRIPRGESVVSPGSRCPRCGRAIRAWENIPVLSYLALGGRCAGCREPISARYPAVELANGLGWAALVLRHGPTPQSAAAMVFFTVLLVLALIDYEHQLLPDVITLPGVVVGLAASFLPGRPGPVDAVATAAGGYLALALIAFTYRRLRGVEGLGRGDWKMVAMMGAFLGAQGTLLAVMLAALAGTAVGLALMAFRGKDLQTALPFGVFLSVGAAAVAFGGDDLLAAYRRLVTF